MRSSVRVVFEILMIMKVKLYVIQITERTANISLLFLSLSLGLNPFNFSYRRPVEDFVIFGSSLYVVLMQHTYGTDGGTS